MPKQKKRPAKQASKRKSAAGAPAARGLPLKEKPFEVVYDNLKPVEDWTIEDSEAYLAYIDSLNLQPITPQQFADYAGVNVNDVPAAYVAKIEREIDAARQLARALQPGVNAGNPGSIQAMKRVQGRIEAMTRHRKDWATAARQTG